MGKLHSRGLPIYGERERMTERGRVRKNHWNSNCKAGDYLFPG